jgi:hypothetical protein
MALPVHPDAATILRSCAAALRDVVLPEVETPWARYNANLCVASLEYALGLLEGGRNAPNADELAAAIDGLRPDLEASGAAPMRDALGHASPWESASALLVAAQNEGGDLSERVQKTLHPVLLGQLDKEMAAAMPLFIAFAKNMSENQ